MVMALVLLLLPLALTDAALDDFVGLNIKRDKSKIQMGVKGDVSIARTGPGELTFNAKKIMVGSYDLLDMLEKLKKALKEGGGGVGGGTTPGPKKKMNNCMDLLLNSKNSKAKSGVYTFNKKKTYCDMESSGGGWNLLDQFGSADTYGIGTKGLEKAAEMTKNGWTTNAKYLDHGYGPAELKPYSLDFHNSGGAVAWIQKKLPTDGYMVRVKYAHFYATGATLVYVGGKEKVRSAAECKAKNCALYYEGTYSPGDALKLDESQGTAVGAIFEVWYRVNPGPMGWKNAKLPASCMTMRLKGTKKNGLYWTKAGYQYCDMTSSGGGWTLLDQFGSADTYGIGTKGLEKAAEMTANGWTTNAKYLDHGYGPDALKPYSLDFHNSGGAVAWIQKKLPADGNMVRVKYAHFYNSGATLVYVGGKERTRSAVQCKEKSCALFYEGQYSAGDALKLDESQGTSVGAIFAVWYRALAPPSVWEEAKLAESCMAMRIAGTIKSGLYWTKSGYQYCDMTSTGGGWTLLNQFGSADTFGIGKKGIETALELTANGWTTNGKYIDHGYGPDALKPFSIDFHNSGGAVAWVETELPRKGDMVRVKYAHFYATGATLVYVGGKEKARSTAECKDKGCPIFYEGKYSPGDKLKLDESQGTAVGALFNVFYREKLSSKKGLSKSCKTLKASGKSKSGTFWTQNGFDYCDMKTDGGGWTLVDFFGADKRFGLERKGIETAAELAARGWTTNAKYIDHGYGPAAAKGTSMDFHNSGGAVAWIQKSLPSWASEVRVEYAHFYNTGATLVFLDNKEKTRSSKKCSTHPCSIIWKGSYKGSAALKLDESQGTSVGAIYTVFVR